MRIEMNHEDELLIVPQVAYLLGRCRSSTEKLVMTGVLLEVPGRHRRLIRASDLKDYVEQQLGKYERAIDWKRTENKKKYWEQSGYRGSVAASECFITIPQVAFLLQKSRQNIHKLCQKGIFVTTSIPMPNGKEGRYKKLVEEYSLISYVQSKIGCFQKALDYFYCPDTYYFWQSSEKDFEETFIKKEKERSRKNAKV